MAPSSSSTKKAARLAQKGKGQKVRFQGGTLFPMAVAIVIVLGLALVIYARQSRPAADASAPRIDDHWHHVYGFYLCDTWFQLEGDGEALDVNGRPTNVQYARSGIHSHDDGIIHWHPFSSVSIGSRARLGVFLDVYDVDISTTKLEFPEEQRPFLPYQQEDGVFENGETECNGETGELKAVVWENFSDTDSGDTVIADYDNIRLDQDAMVVAIAFVTDDEDVTMPPWAPELEERAQIDGGQLSSNELFPGANVDEDGNITTDDGEELTPDDVGPAVDDTDDADEPATTDAGDADSEEPATTDAADEPATTDADS
ncbi:hypothetical protein [Ilumatobacter coccineus]|nr:hypothetical protein [Ilumatobacter coccineus]